MGVNIDEILASLEETEKTAEETLADNLSAPEEVATETPIEPVEEATSEESSVETSTDDTVELTEDDMQKIAAECDSQGRIMARSFVDEINRLAEGQDDTSEGYVDEPVAETEEPQETVEEEKVAEEEEISSSDYIIGSLYNTYFKEEENNG